MISRFTMTAVAAVVFTFATPSFAAKATKAIATQTTKQAKAAPAHAKTTGRGFHPLRAISNAWKGFQANRRQAKLHAQVNHTIDSQIAANPTLKRYYDAQVRNHAGHARVTELAPAVIAGVTMGALTLNPIVGGVAAVAAGTTDILVGNWTRRQVAKELARRDTINYAKGIGQPLLFLTLAK